MENYESATPASSSFFTPARIVITIAVAVFLFASAWMVGSLRSRISALETQQATAQQEISQLKLTAQTLASQQGITQQELAAKTAQLARSQKVAVSKLASAQSEQIERVNNQVSGVATEVGNTKTDLAATKADLDATKAKLDRTIGDLGVQSGLIAHTAQELDVLKHKGDRDYYEFALDKGKHPTPVSTISLQLKKVDTKHNRFTLNVIADDKTIEKKDRTLFEPLQFYTGKDHMLYELVVNEVAKNRVSGYVSTPKSAPQPVSQ